MLTLRGRVIKVTALGARIQNKYAAERHNKVTLFEMEAEDYETTYKMKYEGFLPVETHDYIVAKVSKYPDAYLITDRPFVKLPDDPDIIIQKLCSTKLSKREAELFYCQIEDKFPATTVISYLNRISRYYAYQNNHNITQFEKVGWKVDAIKGILEWWFKYRVMRQLTLLGPTKDELKPLLNHIGYDKIIELCLTNPYALYSVKATTVANLVTTYELKLSDDQYKCGEITREIYQRLSKDGYTCTPLSMLTHHPDLPRLTDMLANEYFVIFEYNSAYLPYPHKVETYMAKWVSSQLQQKFAHCELPPDYKLEKENQEHRSAINHALQLPISAIIGPAGSGKTTLIIELVKFIGADKVIVTSFTGKAVTCLRKKFNEHPDLRDRVHLKTMDSLIYSKKIDVSCVIIDEISMVTTELMYRFICKYGSNFRLILVGDLNQLPPIGWGSFMLEIQHHIQVFRLEKSYRSEGNSKILQNSLELRVERNKPYYFRVGPEFQLYHGDHSTIEEAIQKLKRCVDLKRVTIICSSGKSKVGSHEIKHTKILNEIFQSIAIPPDQRHVIFNGGKWAIGDRVMMTVNNWSQNLANGDEGYIVDILDGEGENTPGKLIINFPDIVDQAIFELSHTPENLDEVAKELLGLTEDGKPQEEGNGNDGTPFNLDQGDVFNDEYKDGEKKPPPKKPLHASSLVLAYAMTVHKSQGSEYDYVIVYLPTFREAYSTRNLLYTAITRAKCWVNLFQKERGKSCPTIIELMTMENLPNRHDNLFKRLTACI